MATTSLEIALKVSTEIFKFQLMHVNTYIYIYIYIYINAF
jgi:hypothetical protein